MCKLIDGETENVKREKRFMKKGQNVCSWKEAY